MFAIKSGGEIGHVLFRMLLKDLKIKLKIEHPEDQYEDHIGSVKINGRQSKKNVEKLRQNPN